MRREAHGEPARVRRVRGQPCRRRVESLQGTAATVPYPDQLEIAHAADARRPQLAGGDFRRPPGDVADDGGSAGPCELDSPSHRSGDQLIVDNAAPPDAVEPEGEITAVRLRIEVAEIQVTVGVDQGRQDEHVRQMNLPGVRHRPDLGGLPRGKNPIAALDQDRGRVSRVSDEGAAWGHVC